MIRYQAQEEGGSTWREVAHIVRHFREVALRALFCSDGATDDQLMSVREQEWMYCVTVCDKYNSIHICMYV